MNSDAELRDRDKRIDREKEIDSKGLSEKAKRHRQETEMKTDKERKTYRQTKR